MEMRRLCSCASVQVCLCAAALLPVLGCLVRLVYVHLQDGECEMTWMYRYPHYQENERSDTKAFIAQIIKLREEVETAFPQYSLHLYKESTLKEDPKLHTSPPVLRGIPVLFIPGNAGSHKQVRSSASIALLMHPAEFPQRKHFDFFAVNLNEEFSGLFGGVLKGQTVFVAACIDHILSLYNHVKHPWLSVAIIAHSMGGMVAQALFTLPDFNHSHVHTIITLASPLKRPVLAFDHLLLQLYKDVHKVWLEGGVASHVTVVSIAGGERDWMVPTHLTQTKTNHSINMATEAVPRNWVGADHQAVVWCRRVQLAVSRALFHLQDPTGSGLTQDHQQKVDVLSHFLLRGRKVLRKASHPVQLSMKGWKNVTDLNYWQEGVKTGYSAVAIPTSKLTNSNKVFLLLASNTDKDTWLYKCAAVSNKKTAKCTDISSSAALLPPKIGVVKYVTLRPEAVSQDTSYVVMSQPHNPRTKGFLLTEYCDEVERELQLCDWSHPWHLCMWGAGQQLVFPANHCTFMNFTLPQLTKLWRAYTLTLSSCPPLRGGLVTPWHPHTPLLHTSTSSQLTLSLSLQTPAPPNGVPHILTWAPHNCDLRINIEPDYVGLMEKLLLVYAPLLLPWVAAVFISSPGTQHSPYHHYQLPIAITILYAHTYLEDSWLPETDWQLLVSEGLWCVWVPHLLHLIALGLQWLLRLTVRMTLGVAHCIMRGRPPWGVSCTLIVVAMATLFVCSSVSLLLMMVVYALNATDQKSRDIVCVLLCVLLFTLPSLFSWAKTLPFMANSFPDPHFWSVAVANTVTIAMLLRSSPNRKSNSSDFIGGQPFQEEIHNPDTIIKDITSKCWFTLLDTTTDTLISLLVLLYATVHAYRTTYLIAAYITLTAIKAFTN